MGSGWERVSRNRETFSRKYVAFLFGLVCGNANDFLGQTENARYCVFASIPLLSAKRLAFLSKGSGSFLFPSGAIEREMGKESRQFLVDILTLVAVALGQRFFSV